MVEKIRVTDVFGKKEFDACEEHNRRLDRMETNIAKLTGTKRAEKFKKPGQWTRWYIEADAVFKNNSKDEILYKKLQKDLCVIIPTHRYQRPWLKACLEGVKKLGYFSILAYDNPYHKGQVGRPTDQLLPPNDVMALADYISVKPKTLHSGVTVPHMWNMVFAVNQAFALGFEYIFCVNGDFIMERPQNFQQLRDMMGDADIFPLAWNHKKPSCGTAAFIAKIDPQVKFWREFANTLHQPKGNAEARLGRFYIENKLKVFHNSSGPMSHQMPNKNSDWYNTVGLRHLHAENKLRRWTNKPPVEKQYFDQRFMTPNERRCLTAYWKDGDVKNLKNWWGAKGKK
ncbi:MAG: hypothetical protein ACTSX1_13855 [Candidatus Heimdallarchaeaceae archaeon]